ncbi:hypothetical protein PHOSAC3_140283 [Mesotoga infera]|nr:hypothetical protein PHOSAC3_140283 [Mesotoga infera]
MSRIRRKYLTRKALRFAYFDQWMGYSLFNLSVLMSVPRRKLKDT